MAPAQAAAAEMQELQPESKSVKPKRARLPNGFPDRWALILPEQKRDEGDPEAFIPCVNGLNVQLTRGEWAPINWAFVYALDNAVMPKYSTEVGQQRKVVGTVKRYNYKGPYPISREKYEELSVIARVRPLTQQEVEAAIGYPVH